jgi:ornithine carbamoyltransferase
VFAHSVVERMAAVSPVPVVNLLSDDAHPLQAIADLLTLADDPADLAGRRLAYVGDANNVARSLGLAAAMVGMEVRFGSPPGYAPTDAMLDRIRATGVEPFVTHRAEEAVDGADAVYTDVWTSMGQETEAAERRKAFEGFGVDGRLMAAAAPGAVFLHCLPAHRGEEVSAEVADGPASRIWQQAENRMHAARAVFWWLLDQAEGSS